GLGHDFLAHVERTRLLVGVLDLAPLDGSDPVENHATVERELERHDARLASLPRILALSKADLVPPARAEEAAAEWRERRRCSPGWCLRFRPPRRRCPGRTTWPSTGCSGPPPTAVGRWSGRGMAAFG